jgi:hypothetical protein
MKNIYTYILILIVLFVLYFCFNQWSVETFDDITDNLENVKKFISSNLDDDSKLREPYIAELIKQFNESQKESLENRLTKFKQIIEGKTEIDKSLLDDLYFDLRMNETANIRDKLILGYKIASDFIKNGELHITPKNVISHNPESKTQFIKLIKDYAKDSLFNGNGE